MCLISGTGCWGDVSIFGTRHKYGEDAGLQSCCCCFHVLHVSQALVKVQDSIGLDGVTTFNEFAVPLVARLAERLGLPGEGRTLQYITVIVGRDPKPRH